MTMMDCSRQFRERLHQCHWRLTDVATLLAPRRRCYGSAAASRARCPAWGGRDPEEAAQKVLGIRRITFRHAWRQ